MASQVDPIVTTQDLDKPHDHRRELGALAAITLLLLVVGALLVWRVSRKVNHVALAAEPRLVSVVNAASSEYRDGRSYVGAVEPWIEANVGPQYISAYVKSVLVRPGDQVTAGQILATLDCANPSASSRAVAMQARAVTLQQHATADQAAREASMLDGGFIAPNEVEQTTAQSSAQQAQYMATQAKLTSAALDVNDCEMRAPFDGEIGLRMVDPGAFVRPGSTIVSVVDRNTVRVTVDAAEKDFTAADIGTPVQVHMLSTDVNVRAKISRRAPQADPSTRTIHFEIDIVDPQRKYPTATTALVQLDVGNPRVATSIPIFAATQQEGKATFFSVENGVARQRHEPVLGERGGEVYFDPSVLAPNTQVVAQGRALLSDGDRVTATMTNVSTDESDGGTRGGGYGRPL